MDNQVLAIDIGGTKIRCVVLDRKLRILAERTVATPKNGAKAIVDQIVQQKKSLAPEVKVIGIAATGVVAPETGKILSASDTIADWSGFPLGQAVTQATGCLTVVENDVNAFLLGELVARGQTVSQFKKTTSVFSDHILENTDSKTATIPNALGIMLGTGVGGAVVINGEIWRGEVGAAAEIGHCPGFGNLQCTCGQYGHLESWVGGRCLLRNYRVKAEQENYRAEKPIQSTAEVAELAKQGNEIAKTVFYEAGQALGKSISIFVTLYDVAEIILGGSVSRAWTLLEPGYLKAINANPPVSGVTPKISLATVGDEAVLYGAGHLAWKMDEK